MYESTLASHICEVLTVQLVLFVHDSSLSRHIQSKYLQLQSPRIHLSTKRSIPFHLDDLASTSIGSHIDFLFDLSLVMRLSILLVDIASYTYLTETFRPPKNAISTFIVLQSAGELQASSHVVLLSCCKQRPRSCKLLTPFLLAHLCCLSLQRHEQSSKSLSRHLLLLL